MPTIRSRIITEAHPVARYLFLADQLGPTDTLVLEYATEQEAKRSQAALSRFRAASRLGPPGSFEPTNIDPKGEGLGFFDRVSVGVRPRFSYSGAGYDVILSRIPEGQTSRRVRFPLPTAQRIETSGSFDPPIPDLPDGALA